MEITEALILKFFRQECTPEERTAVNKYFDDYPDELDKYLDERGWMDFAEKSPLSIELSRQMLEVIEDHIQATPVRRIFPFKSLAIAASIIIIAGVILLISNNLRKDKITNPLLAGTKKTMPDKELDTIDNKTGNAMAVLLSDSSTVSLTAKSKIIFSKVFDKDKRDVYLYGEAIFKVTKNKHRPFTVYAGNFSTTALGTSFKITAFANSNKTVIQLFTGKVVVKQVNTVNGQRHSAVYLDPGYTAEASNSANDIKVSGFKDDNTTTTPSAGEGLTLFDNDLIIFKNQSLTAVVNVLKKSYHVDIAVNPQDISNRYFTGTVNSKSETPYAVLSTIARLNNLKVIKQNESYRLAAVKM